MLNLRMITAIAQDCCYAFVAFPFDCQSEKLSPHGNIYDLELKNCLARFSWQKMLPLDK
jgi:hypothetical protein